MAGPPIWVCVSGFQRVWLGFKLWLDFGKVVVGFDRWCVCGFVICGGCGLDWWWKRKVAGFWLWQLGWCVVGCWVLVMATRMVGCGLLDFGCGSWDGQLWLFVMVFWVLWRLVVVVVIKWWLVVGLWKWWMVGLQQILCSKLWLFLI